MLKYVNHDIVFQEFPDEVTLAINLSRCPCRCLGCHSPQLWGDVGEELTETRLFSLLDYYGSAITCVGLMGGDNDPDSVWQLLAAAKRHFPRLRTGWYSGRDALPSHLPLAAVPDYVKLGPWRADCGPLSARTTNQRLFRFHADGRQEDLTARFWK